MSLPRSAVMPAVNVLHERTSSRQAREQFYVWQSAAGHHQFPLHPPVAQLLFSGVHFCVAPLSSKLMVPGEHPHHRPGSYEELTEGQHCLVQFEGK